MKGCRGHPCKLDYNTGRTIGDLRGALSPYFGVKRADVIAITEATRAL